MAKLPPAAAEEMRAAVYTQAHILSKAQASAVHERHGNLRASHRVEAGNHPLQAKVKAGGLLTTRTTHGVAYDYANANEFGTEKMPAQPSFWPTYRLLKRRIRAAIQRNAIKGLKKVVNLK